MRNFINTIQEMSGSPSETLADVFVKRIKSMSLPARVKVLPIDDQSVELTDLLAHSPGHGQGRETMRAIISLADEMGITLSLWPFWDENVENALYQDDLWDWYIRLGFKQIPNRDFSDHDGDFDRYLMREPKSA